MFLLHASAGELFLELLRLEGDKRIEIAFAADGLVGGKQDEQDNDTDDEADQVTDIGGGKQNEAGVLERIAELVIGLAVVGDGDEGDIEGRSGGEPARVHRKLAERDRADDADGGGQRAGGMERRKPQAVDTQLHDDQLPIDG